MAAINITEQVAAAPDFEVYNSTYTITLPSTTTPPTPHYYVHYNVYYGPGCHRELQSPSLKTSPQLHCDDGLRVV